MNMTIKNASLCMTLFNVRDGEGKRRVPKAVKHV
jgi:hypothetical protein